MATFYIDERGNQRISVKKTTKVITIHSDSDSENDCNENTENNKENIQNNLNFKELEYREKDLVIKEWKIALRE
ncbi:hypothetical protein RhiirA1_456557 [Rhizophagus irregularis]|uniref:Uncharacterized protein n=1 Tax=Rhizophagus irregularis TaxID=588596 RepID=A0A2I1E733_9GLOM|nr:hypothetical protein RhiirA1_456557 [Rhizophagus irregularis]PKY17933.1 hypothetical protein RhiirB3_430655 [Rhizophagus irregularis]